MEFFEILPLLLATLLAADIASAICPNMCTCDLDSQGRKRTRCETGGVSIPGSFDLTMLDADVDVLIVTGSRQRPNTFQLNANMLQNKRLKEIHLSFSSMDLIGDRTFYHVSNTLMVLNLTHNSLRSVAENNFRNLSRLTHLHLDYNRIESVHSAMFSYLTNLKVLTISNNLIKDVPQRMGLQLAKLEELDMSQNPIGVPVIQDSGPQSIPDSFFSDFPALIKLNLANASLVSLPWTVIRQSNPKLEELDLSGNQIPGIQQNQLSLIRNLKRVALSGNPIQRIEPNALQGLYLDKLDLSSLNQNVLQPGIFQGTRVSYLDLSNMGLIALNSQVFLPISQDLVGLNISQNPALVIQPRMFEFLPALKFFTMSRMRKPQLPSDFFSYTNVLENVDLSDNGLLDIEDPFLKPLSNVMYLNLAKNQLQRVPLAVNLPKIKEIDLGENLLSNFPENLVTDFSAPASPLTSLRLNSNPWNCDCGVSGLGRWLISQHGHPGEQVVCVGAGNFTCPVCYEPANLKGTPLNRLPATIMDTCVPTGPTNQTGTANVDVIIAVVVCLIVLIIAILLLVLWYRNRLHSYRTYEEKRKGEPYENGDAADVFDDAPPINKPKGGGLPPVRMSVPPPTVLPKAESDV